MYTLNAAFVGKVLMVFDELPSTNDYARLMANEEHTAEGTAVLARRQTSGRGQMGTVWESAPDDNLTLSIVLRPVWLRADRQFYLSKAVALAVYDTVDEAVQEKYPDGQLFIKWPNDILLNRKKIAGILIENTISGPHLGVSVVGIGLNINQPAFSPALPSAGSLSGITGHRFDVDQLAQRLFFHIEKRYIQLQHGATHQINADYLGRLWGYRQNLTFAALPDEASFTGTITGVDEDGRLVVERDGVEVRYNLKEVKQGI